jgi:protein O-mannosyl-transferase
VRVSLCSRTTLLVALFAIGLYAISIPGDFVYDDVAIILKDTRLSDPTRWGELWTDSYNAGVDNLYRPLVSMSYAIQYQLHGPLAWPFHLVNVLLHGVVSALVTWVAYRLAICTGAPHPGPLAIVAGLLFASHPVHVEAVANIVGRAEMMCAIGALGAIGLATFPLTRSRVVGIWLLTLSAILCKEQGLLVPVMVGVVAWVTRRTTEPTMPSAIKNRRGEGALLFALLMASLASIVVLRESILRLKFWWDRAFLDPWIQPLADSSGIDRWLAPFTIVGRYAQLLVAPVALRIDYGGPIVPGVFDPSDPYSWLGLVGVIVFFTLLIFSWRRDDRFLLATLLLFACAYALVSNWPTIIGVNVAERLMYLPSAFFVILVARGLVALPRRGMVALVTTVVLLFSVRTVSYAWRWTDRLTLYEFAVRVEPRAMKAILLAMQEHVEGGRLDAAERYGRQATTLDPNYDEAWLRLAGVLIDRGALDEAALAIEKARAIRIAPRLGVYEEKLNAARAAAATRAATGATTRATTAPSTQSSR